MRARDFETADGRFDKAKLASVQELENNILSFVPVTAADLAIRYIVEGGMGDFDIGAEFAAYCATLIEEKEAH